MRKARCRFFVEGSVNNGDRCRRELNHGKRGLVHGEWHLPECGHAVNDQGEWMADERWHHIYDEIVASGEGLAQ